MKNNKPYRIKTITEFHDFRGIQRPEHPLVSVINVETIKRLRPDEPPSLVLDFYAISMKRSLNGKLRYGQQVYDFDEGCLFFMAPNQVFSIEIGEDKELKQTGWMLLVHPDFLWNTSLAQNIKKYDFFDYSVNEALFLSVKEESIITGIMKSILQEYHSNIDDFSQDIIISHLELLLSYAERYYHRQFLTRKMAGHKVLDRMESLLAEYFNGDDLMKKGLPTVGYIAANLGLSPGYLSSLLKVLTGQSTQQHIHMKLIEIAKEKLSTTDLSVGEIARILGFEHPQSFNKLFKKKTNLSPLEFRESFN